ncbi:MAG: exosortase family protein XrtG [Anaerolineales bacterium]
MVTAIILLLFIIWLGLLIFLHTYRVWLFYYLVGVVGCAYFLVWFLRGPLNFEPALAYSVALTVHSIANLLEIPTRIFENAPGVLLVLVVVQRLGAQMGWTVLRIGVESSGLLEICVLASLLAFYPGWRWQRRTLSVGFGILVTWVANVLRLLVIVILLHGFGKNALVLAHTYIGKAFFFALIIWLYWYLITARALDDLSERWKPS